eukprot:6372306-Alexandrium_andersonii.AAC.1
MQTSCREETSLGGRPPWWRTSTPWRASQCALSDLTCRTMGGRRELRGPAGVACARRGATRWRSAEPGAEEGLSSCGRTWGSPSTRPVVAVAAVVVMG